MVLHLRVMECHLPYGIVQCYLPLDGRRKWTHPTLTLANQAGTRFIYHRETEGWVDLDDWLYTAMVYPPTEGHPCKY